MKSFRLRLHIILATASIAWASLLGSGAVAKDVVASDAKAGAKYVGQNEVIVTTTRAGAQRRERKTASELMVD